MDEFEEIVQIEPGRYSFFVGVHQYTLTSPMEKERLVRVISKVQQLVDTFPVSLTQDQRLFLALITTMNKMDRLELKIDGISSKIKKEREQG